MLLQMASSDICSEKKKKTIELPLVSKTIQVRRTRHAGNSWKSKDELISDVFLWTPIHGRASVVWSENNKINLKFPATSLIMTK